MNEKRISIHQEFHSEEDLDLENLSWEELLVVWDLWLKQVQSTNQEDPQTYEHGVFTWEPSAA